MRIMGLDYGIKDCRRCDQRSRWRSPHRRIETIQRKEENKLRKDLCQN